jgi:hypothetical protein
MNARYAQENKPQNNMLGTLQILLLVVGWSMLLLGDTTLRTLSIIPFSVNIGIAIAILYYI